MSDFERTTRPSDTKTFRIMGSLIGQKRKTIICPNVPNLAGKNVLITGGASGVGESVSHGLIARGAKVTSAARGVSASSIDLPSLTLLQMDLGDPHSVVAAVKRLEHGPFDILVFNAGINSTAYVKTTYGMEQTYAVSVFGHHLLFRLLKKHGLITPDARVIFTTGDIYVLAKDCTSDFVFKRGPMA